MYDSPPRLYHTCPPPYWELATSLDIPRRAPVVFLSLEGKASEAASELNIATLNVDDDMKKLYEKLDALFFEGANWSPFTAHESFELYR